MKRVFNLLVVDESGSMEIIRKQALVGINETLETICKIHKAHSELEQRVTLITFDSTHKNCFMTTWLLTTRAVSVCAIIIRAVVRRSTMLSVWASRKSTHRLLRATTCS